MRSTLLTIAFATLAVLMLVAPGHTATLVVDADKVQCPEAEFTTIQQAVAAASPGDLVQVCPDTYVGPSIDVTTPLTIRGPRQWGECLVPATADPTRDAIVQGQGTFGFRVFVNDVTIEGLVIQNTSIGLTHPVVTSGQVARDNLFQGNFQAYSLGFRDISDAAVEANCFRQNAIGIGSTGGAVATAIIGNTFFANTYGLQFNTNLGRALDVDITGNVSLDDTFFVFITGTTGSEISQNSVRRASVGLQVAGRNNGLRIAGNTFEDAGTAVQVFSFFGPPLGGPNTNLEISSNDVARATQFGIFATLLESSLIESNDIRDSGIDAIRMMATTRGNEITDNKLKRSGEHDCHDDSAGGGTAGSANTWTRNKGKTENRPGLCDKN